MRVRRDISSVPFQSASATWKRILELVTGPDSKDVEQLRAASNVVGSIITDELPAQRAILFEGVGPQLRIYCRFGKKAVEAGATVDLLTWNPTAGDWTMHVPCDAENMDWVKKSLAKTSPRIRIFDVAEDERADAEDAAVTASSKNDLTVEPLAKLRERRGLLEFWVIFQRPRPISGRFLVC